MNTRVNLSAALRTTLPWSTVQECTNVIEFVDNTGNKTGLQLMNPNDEDISACDQEIAAFILDAINSKGTK